MIMTMAIVVVAIVHMLMHPLQPKQLLRYKLRRFFYACAQITSSFIRHKSGRNAKEFLLRTHYFGSLITPMPQQLQLLEKEFADRLFKTDGDIKMQQLLSGLQGIVDRLKILETSHQYFLKSTCELPPEITNLCNQLLEHMQIVFNNWDNRTQVNRFRIEGTAIYAIFEQLKQEVNAFYTQDAECNNQALENTYALIGCIRGLLTAMERLSELTEEIGTCNQAVKATA